MEDTTVAQQTLALLEDRLQRLQFLLYGETPIDYEQPTTKTDLPVAARLQRMESSMESLQRRSADVAQYLEQRDLGGKSTPVESTDSLSTMTLASLVLSHAPSLHSTASRLTSLNDLPLPEASQSADLVSLRPKLDKAGWKATKQEAEIAMLQARSAAVIGRWYELGTIGAGECWSDWEGRLINTERAVRQEQSRRKRDDETG